MKAPQEANPLTNTACILARAQTGDGAARDEILLRYQEPLEHFLCGRLSHSSRAVVDTRDIVQETLTAALGQLERFEYSGGGSFWGYLRRIGINLIHQEKRRQRSRPIVHNDCARLAAAAEDSRESPPAALERKETSAALEAALEQIPEQAREALLLRLELELPFGVIASECGYPSADAARMAIGRNMSRLADALAAFEL